jgi:hypothetical protein
MKKTFTYVAICECGWKSTPQETASKAQRAAKQHANNDVHRDFDDVPLFDN